MPNNTKILAKLMRLNNYGRSYPFKVIAFVKAVVNGREVVAHSILNPNADLQDFIDRFLNPMTSNPNQVINSMNYRFTTFHAKVKGGREFTMAANPQYLISHSVRKGFFDKRKTNPSTQKL